MVNEKIRIKLKAFDHKILDQSVGEIIDIVSRSGAEVVGPIPLPTKIHKYTVLRSPHVNKKAREQFEMRIHRRILDILSPTKLTMDELMKTDLSAGVEIEIKMN
ncbi:MAG: 30S ribosomal protein S10 [bacterium]